MILEAFLERARARLRGFEKMWREEGAAEGWPESLPEAGWWEHFESFPAIYSDPYEPTRGRSQ